ncbi:hypothetical protein CR513_37830, partial [Mucuna pruriens]
MDVDVDMHSVPRSSQQWGYKDGNRHQDMVFDVASLNHEQRFCPRCKIASELFAAITMLSLKSKHNMSQACFNDVMKFMKESSHLENDILLILGNK